ncbi:MAG TPA: nuclear transport factor 2 family protein [Baekduia sp.]|nr:nuclear transport factor 2 family protein [Baekduia sp.]
MPWIPELFTAPALEHILDERRQERLAAVPYFDGLMTGEVDALVGSFAGEPELHHPVRGRIKGADAFARFATEAKARMIDRNVTIEDVNFVVTPRRGVEEVVVHLDGDDGRIRLPLALAADRDEDSRIIELRIYFSSWPLNGRHAIRPPLLQPDPDLPEVDIVAAYQRALAAGDVDAAVAAFEPDAYLREPAGGAYIHRGTDELRALYERFFSNGGGIPLEHCAVTDNGRSCALEYNVVAWGRTQLAPEAGLAVYVRGDSGKLAIARIYDDADPPLSQHSQGAAGSAGTSLP